MVFILKTISWSSVRLLFSCTLLLIQKDRSFEIICPSYRREIFAFIGGEYCRSRHSHKKINMKGWCLILLKFVSNPREDQIRNTSISNILQKWRSWKVNYSGYRHIVIHMLHRGHKWIWYEYPQDIGTASHQYIERLTYISVNVGLVINMLHMALGPRYSLQICSIFMKICKHLCEIIIPVIEQKR